MLIGLIFGQARLLTNTTIIFAIKIIAPLFGHVDEQALCLAPEKHDFMATYTLGATM